MLRKVIPGRGRSASGNRPAWAAVLGTCAALAWAVAGCAPASARPAPQRDRVEVDPAVAGMDPAALARVDSVILAALADSAAPGAALAIGRRGALVRLRGYGVLDWGSGAPVTPETLFDLASLTKVVGTATAALRLEAEGRLELDAPVARYLPWWVGADARKREVTVRQLLTHRSGLAAFRPWYLDHRGAPAYREALTAERLEHDPGTRTLYSDLGFLTLGMVLEAVADAPLDRLLEDRVWRPLGMGDTGFLPDRARLPRVAPTEKDTVWRHAHVRGRPHDENADAIGGVAGHAGLFSTARDLAVFADAMLGAATGPMCAGARADPCAEGGPADLLPSAGVRRWTQRADGGGSYALGWDTPEGPRSSAGDYLSARAFGHTGFTGTSLWIDPELELFVVLLTHRVNPTRANDRHVALRRAVHDAAAQAVVDRPVRVRGP